MTAEQAMQAIGAAAVAAATSDEIATILGEEEGVTAEAIVDTASNDEPTPAPAPSAPAKSLFAAAPTPVTPAAAPKKTGSIFSFAQPKAEADASAQ